MRSKIKVVYKKESQEFVGKGLDAVAWGVECVRVTDRDGYYEGNVSAYFDMSDSLKCIYVEDFKTLRKLRAEMSKFEDAVMEAREIADRINGEDADAEE